MAMPGAEYKRRNIRIWNEVAPRYHRRWAGRSAGPFQSSKKLVDMLNLKRGSRVLDVACGTGAVTRRLVQKVGSRGLVVGTDTSLAAISIAKKWNGKKANLHFVNADAERLGLAEKFDAVACQYALFFFPDAAAALRNMKDCIRRGGMLGIAVHGKDTPFFTAILDAVTGFIPDYVPAGAPALDRYGTAPALRREVRNAGFGRIRIESHTFRYSPGKFADYWRDYLRYVPRPLKEKLDGLGRSGKMRLRAAVQKNTAPYTGTDGTIRFPWQVLILSAQNNTA